MCLLLRRQFDGYRRGIAMAGRTAGNRITGLIFAAALLAGCGGGGESPQSQTTPPTGAASVLAWAPPATFNDNTPLNPVTDIEFYELYLRPDPNFTESDPPAIQIAAVADIPSQDGRSVVQGPVTEFTLELIPSLPNGNLLYVSMRAVGVDGQKSSFMTPVAWNRS
ncbi:MAG: hypothetical protein OHK0028_03870 [Deltaproteobacteria bacterium]